MLKRANTRQSWQQFMKALPSLPAAMRSAVMTTITDLYNAQGQFKKDPASILAPDLAYRRDALGRGDWRGVAMGRPLGPDEVLMGAAEEPKWWAGAAAPLSRLAGARSITAPTGAARLGMNPWDLDAAVSHLHSNGFKTVSQSQAYNLLADMAGDPAFRSSLRQEALIEPPVWRWPRPLEGPTIAPVKGGGPATPPPAARAPRPFVGEPAAWSELAPPIEQASPSWRSLNKRTLFDGMYPEDLTTGIDNGPRHNTVQFIGMDGLTAAPSAAGRVVRAHDDYLGTSSFSLPNQLDVYSPTTDTNYHSLMGSSQAGMLNRENAFWQKQPISALTKKKLTYSAPQPPFSERQDVFPDFQTIGSAVLTPSDMIAEGIHPKVAWLAEPGTTVEVVDSPFAKFNRRYTMSKQRRWVRTDDYAIDDNGW